MESSRLTMTPLLCEVLKPPPLPPGGTQEYQRIVNFIYSNETFREEYRIYSNACNITFPTIPSSTSKGIAVTTQLSPTSNTTQVIHTDMQTTDMQTTDIISGAVTAGASGSVAAIVVTVLLVLIIVFAVFGAVWYKKYRKHGSRTIPQLPLSEYARTNYLDNKARQNVCWKGSKTHDEDNPATVIQQTDYVTIETHENRESNTSDVANTLSMTTLSPLRLSSAESKTGRGCDNKNFEADELTPSPGVTSQTPLFADEADGKLVGEGTNGKLPNVPEKVDEDNGVILRQKSVSKNGHVNKSDSTLPPIRKGERLSTQSDSVSSSQKKKQKTKFLARTSEPVRGMEEMVQAENRKTF